MPFVQVAGLEIDPSRAGLPHELAAFDLGARQTDLAQHRMSESHVLAGRRGGGDLRAGPNQLLVGLGQDKAGRRDLLGLAFRRRQCRPGLRLGQ